MDLGSPGRNTETTLKPALRTIFNDLIGVPTGDLVMPPECTHKPPRLCCRQTLKSRDVFEELQHKVSKYHATQGVAVLLYDNGNNRLHLLAGERVYTRLLP